MKQRIEYLDALRGLTIILVVFSHIVVLGLHTKCEPNNIFIIFRMPLFFFISGFFAFAVYSPALMRKRIANRLLKQFLPTVIAFLAFVVIFNLDMARSVRLDDKTGFWFTPVALEFFLTYMLFVLLFRALKASRALQTAFLIIISVAFGIFFLCIDGKPAFRNIEAVKYLCLYYYVLYFPFFFLGVLAKMHLSRFFALLGNRFVIFFAFAAFLIGFIFPTDVYYFVQRILAVALVFWIFMYFKNSFSGATFIGRKLALLGRYTLEIYLLHYFVLRLASPYLREINLKPLAAHWSLQLLAYTLLATAICALIAFSCKAIMHSFAFLRTRPLPRSRQFAMRGKSAMRGFGQSKSKKTTY